MMKTRKGFFITFEGGEGAGKTTLIEGIERAIQNRGREVLRTREPGGTKIGEEIRQILLQHSQEDPLSPYAEFCLFLASRSQHIAQVIGPALKQGKVVLCDRFNDSSVAYQGAARGLGMEKVSAFCEFISQGLQPNLTLYLDIEPELGLKRRKNERAQDRIESEALFFHERIREAYLEIHRAEPHRFHLIDATQPPPKVLEDALRLIDAHL